MKAIMYHYVRPDARDMPYFRYLSLDNFRRQLDHFEAEYGFLSQAAFQHALKTGAPQPGVVLTFDDAMSDHHDFVFPELAERGLWGIFYVPTGVYTGYGMLDVHRVHVLIGTFGGTRVLDALEPMVTPEMVPDERVAAFRSETYTLQDNDAATNRVKRILNYFIAYDHRRSVLDRLMTAFFGQSGPNAETFYMTAEHMDDMAKGGQVIGSHSVTHPVFSKLDRAAQADEIKATFPHLAPLMAQAPFKTFCYPYGGFHSFTADTEALLTEAGCAFSFNVEQRDIERSDLLDRPQALPRYDCNLFPHGTASMG